MRKANVKKIILASLKTAGLVSVAVLTPNALQALAQFDKNLGRNSYRRSYYLNRAIEGLYQKGLIKLGRNKAGIFCARLTEKGVRELERYELGEMKIKKPRRWDGKYRVIIFDIKEWKRGIRDQLRAWLENLGFIRLQNSVWVYPYECQEVIVLLKSHFKIGKEILYLTVESIENDGWLKREFGV